MDEAAYQKHLNRIIRRLRRYSSFVDEKLIEKAFFFAKDAHKDQLRKSGEPYFDHPVWVAKTLTDLKLDFVTVIGGLLHDVVEDTGVTLAEVEDEFSAEIALLVDGVTKISELKFDSAEQRQAENFRKMILTMVKDVRVILIKFADRLHNMRTLDYLPPKKQLRIAIETRDVYAPLAHRLGIAKVKWELEDLCMKAIEPNAYWELVRNLSDRRDEREAYIRKFATPIRKELKDAEIKAKITGRPKHLFSIYQKMEKYEKSLDEIYDLLAIRIIVKRVEDCYFALGLVHSLFTPIQERFKDYIATPKSNMYQSLHTTVIGADGIKVEVQIRTDDMHRTAEEGVAAHWRYKDGQNREDDVDKHLTWLRQVLEWQNDTNDPKEYMENLRIDLFQDEVFVFSPRGDLFKLPLGSTPVDFAFAVHTDVGLHCIGAKIGGKIVSLNYELNSGDSVEILTSANQKPNLDWLKFVRTTKARGRIKKWLRESKFEQSQKLGEEILLKQFRRYKINKDQLDLKELAQSFGLTDSSQLLAAVGRGDISIQGVLSKIAPEKFVTLKDESVLKKFISRARGSANGVRVQGLDNLLIHFAKCCHPVPGDKIFGFISRGRGVIIHRTDCKNIAKLLEASSRSIDVEWDVEKDRHFLVRLHILAEDRKNFLRDVTEKISQTDTNIVSIDLKTEDSVVNSDLIVEVKNLKHLTKVMNNIGKVKGTIAVERLNGTGETVVD
ncbi:MAG: RelA/SpoT family protein [bacterium]